MGQVDSGDEPRTGGEPTTPATASPQEPDDAEATDTESHPAAAPSDGESSGDSGS